MSEIKNNETSTVTLQVDIPHSCEVGSTINVQYEGKYYQIIVPAGAPGNSIQVILPLIKAVNVKVEGHDVNVVDAEAIEDPEEIENHKSKNIVVGVAAVSGVVIGTLLLGPVLTGAVILSGVAMYGASKTQPVKDSNILQSVHQFDEKHEISKTIDKTTKKIVEKVSETDEKYKISVTADKMIDSTIVSLKEFDNKHEITQKVSNLNKKYEITDNITKAFNYGFNSVNKLTGSTGTGTTGTTSHNHTTHNNVETSSGTIKEPI